MANRLSSVIRCGLTSAMLLSLSIQSAKAHQQSLVDKKKTEDQLIICLYYVAMVQIEVRDQDGNEVTDLQKDDFILYEDGVRQELCYWQRNVGSDRQTDQPMYEAGYYPMNNRFEGEYRAISVLVQGQDMRKLKVRFTPKGYYAKKEMRR